MSRTDKDRPYWVRANDSGEIRHVYHRHYALYKNTTAPARCTVDDAMPNPYAYKSSTGRGKFRSDAYPPCGYDLGYNRDHKSFLCEKIAKSPRKFSEDRRIYTHVPHRRHERDALKKMSKEYNTFYDIEDDDFFDIVADFAWYN